MRAAMVVVLAAGCRLHFDPADDVTIDGATTPKAIAFVQQSAAFTPVLATASTTIGFVNSVGAHDAILVAAFVKSDVIALVEVTDTLGNTYDPIVGFGAIDGDGRRFYLLLATDTLAGPDTLSVMLSGVPTNELEVMIEEYSGVATSNAFDTGTIGFGALAGGAADELQSGFMTTADDYELIVGYGVGGGFVTPGTGFSSRNTANGDLLEERIVSTRAAYQATAAVASGPWAMAMAALKAR